MESYAKKQFKIHKNACCFCSPDCRNNYFQRLRKKQIENFKKPVQKNTNILDWVDRFFRG